MQIIKTPNDTKALFELRKKALIECGICPFCGENRKDEGNGRINGKGQGIRYLEYIITQEDKVRSKYVCTTCGAEFLSDEYTINFWYQGKYYR